jgi:hypothetical protein
MRGAQLVLKWDLKRISESLAISEEEVISYFRDGRRVSFILERRIRDSFSGWRLAESEGAGHDLVDDKGIYWEVRSVSKNIYFCPSYMVGSGRKFAEPGFIEKLNSIGGYICSDITTFPTVPVYIVPSELIRRLYDEKRLGTNTSISRTRFYSMVLPALAVDSD